MSETPRLSQMLVHTATMLVANDLDRSVAFYRDQFGFAIQYQEEGIALRTGRDAAVSGDREPSHL